MDNHSKGKRLGIENDIELRFRMEFLKEIRLKKSNSSCLLQDIESFSLGPFTSRFWAYRKYINMINSQKEKQEQPFFAWKCLTLHLKEPRGDIYLVVEDLDILKKFLYFLIYILETVDGNRGSAKRLIEKRKTQIQKESTTSYKTSPQKLLRIAKH